MKKLKPFNYAKIVKGEPTNKLVNRARKIASLILWKTDFGVYMDDLPDIYWPDRLWYIHDDEELFDRVQMVVCELINETPWPAKAKRDMINAVNDRYLENEEVK